MVRYAITIFISAFLLFQVQPMVARFILPWFGGSSLVWTTCMLFFQSMLVFGYGYAHFMTNRFQPKTQWAMHSLLLAVAICCLPVKPLDVWKPIDASFPTFRILILLAVSVGLPFFMLSMTGPLLQSWQSKTHPDKSPYRLFALSNFASLAALISYPFVFERIMTVDAQSWGWSLGFGLFAIFAFLSGKQFSDNCPIEKSTTNESSSGDGEKIGLVRILLWTVLPMLASVQLLATTNLMTQEVGSLPFLWIVPLSLYLISFVICFDHPRWYWRPFFYLLFFASSIASAFVLEAGADVPILMQVIGYSAACFGASMCCHGELARSKPGPEKLTMFYLLVSVGGALGGVFVAIIAPRIFVGYYEFQVGIIAAILFCLIAYGVQVSNTESKTRLKDPDSRVAALPRIGFAVALFSGLLVMFFVVVSIGTMWVADHKKTVLQKTRNEYGTLTVKDFKNYRKLTNGEIEHGFQYKADQWRMMPTSYYGPDSGLGLAINFLIDQASVADSGMDYGAIGLGVGTICAWCYPGDTIRFFEINPEVEQVARDHFWYLSECEADSTEVVLGDARLQLEREIENNDERKYDILVADAFSSDSIPMHLLTLESMQIYRDRLKSDGILAFHVSNRFLVLENIVKDLAAELGMRSILIDDSPDADDGLYNGSSWVLVTSNDIFIDEMEMLGLDAEWPDKKLTARWTDDFSSIVPVLNIDKDFDWVTDLLGQKGWVKKKKDKDTRSGN